MRVSILFPYRPSPERAPLFAWISAWWTDRFPNWQQVTGTCSSTEFSRTQAILDAASRADGDVLVVADADVFCPELDPKLPGIHEHGWLVPHHFLHRLAPESTELVMAGTDWHGLPLSTDNHQDSRPYRGHEAGTLITLTRAAFATAPPDPRFVGWGSEDQAWATALRCLVGSPARGGADLVHLYHPPEKRQSRTVGNRHNQRLARRYQAHRRDPDAMRALIAEVTDGRQLPLQAQPRRDATAPAVA